MLLTRNEDVTNWPWSEEPRNYVTLKFVTR